MNTQSDAEAVMDKLSSRQHSVPEMDEIARKFAKWVVVTSEWSNSIKTVYEFNDGSKMEIISNTTLRTF